MLTVPLMPSSGFGWMRKLWKIDVRFAVIITVHVKGLISQVLNMLKQIQSLLLNLSLYRTMQRSIWASQWLSGRESTCNTQATGDLGSVPGSGRPPGGGHGNPLQYSCLENPMGGGASWAMVHGVAKSQTRLKRLSTHAQRDCTGGWLASSKPARNLELLKSTGKL